VRLRGTAKGRGAWAHWLLDLALGGVVTGSLSALADRATVKVLASISSSIIHPTTPIPSASASAPAPANPSSTLLLLVCRPSQAASRRIGQPHLEISPRLPLSVVRLRPGCSKPGCARTLGVSAEQQQQLVASHKQPSCLSHCRSHRNQNPRQHPSQPPLPLGALPWPTSTSPRHPVRRA